MLMIAGHAQGVAVLDAGADLSDCHSALRVGPSVCPAAMVAAGRDDGPSPAGVTTSVPRDPLEREIDSFLSSYGKPPREAVRALLDPSDAHIAAMLAKQQETLAIAAYVANRMTAIQAQARGATADARASAAREAASLAQMRSTLLLHAADPDAEGAADALRVAVDRIPSLQARVVLAGRLAPQRLRAMIARLDPRFTVEMVPDPAPDRSFDELALPVLLIEDLRSHRTMAISAAGVTAADLLEAMKALRNGPARQESDRAPDTDVGGPQRKGAP
jgi:hypothetical protein